MSAETSGSLPIATRGEFVKLHHSKGLAGLRGLKHLGLGLPSMHGRKATSVLDTIN